MRARSLLGEGHGVASAVAYLLSTEASFITTEASFITGATIPVDGGRAALGQDPEARDVTATST